MSTIELTNHMIAEAAGWRNITDDEMGERPGRYGLVPIPDYRHDADDALGLFPDTLWIRLDRIQNNGGWICRIGDYPVQHLEEWNETLPLAICQAWWIWKHWAGE